MKIKLRTGEEITAKTIDDLKVKLKVMYEGRLAKLETLNKERIVLMRVVKEIEKMLKDLGEETVKKEPATGIGESEEKVSVEG